MKKITRRNAISTAGKVAIGVGAAVIVGGGAYAAYLASTPPPAATTTTTTARTTTPTTTTTTTTTTPSATGPSEVRIGAVISLSGPIAAFGQGLRFGHEQAIADLNAQGGINVKGRTLPVRYIVYDDGSDPTKAASLAAQAVLNDNVDVLVQGCNPPVTTNPISVTADRYKVPFVMGSPLEPWWAGGPYKYSWSILFRIGTPSYDHPGYTILDIFFASTDPYKDQTNKKAGILAADDADGRGWYGIFPKVMKDKGYDPIGVDKNLGLYPPGTNDFTSIINEWKSAGADVLWANLPGPDFGVAWRQCSELGFRPKIAIAARAALFYADVSAWGGDLPLGVGIEVWWDPSYPYKGIGNRTPKSLGDAWTAATKTPVNRNIGFGYSAIQIYADAVQRAGTLDKDSVNSAVGETDGMFMTGPIKFFPDTHDSPTRLAFGQWVKTNNPWVWECPIVRSYFPELKPTHDPIFPLPPISA